MTRRWTLLPGLTTAALAVCLGAAQVSAQQERGPWQTETQRGAQPVPAAPRFDPPSMQLPPNTTVVPRSSTEPSKPAATGSGPGQVQLVAVLTEDGQSIEQGLVWTIFRDRPGADGKPRLVSTLREPSPSLRLEPGDYLVNVAFGRAHLTRKITVSNDHGLQERFVLNAGGLRVVPVLSNGEPISERAVSYEIFSDERQRAKVTSAVKPGVIIRLNAGIYNIVSTYGDANAIARADVTVEAGKLTEATLVHAAAKVTFKLVSRAGGDALADTQWNVANANGETVKESVGALPTHILAPGAYTASARNGGELFQRAFTVQAGDTAQVEVVKR
jgi:hypothetical protein